MRGRRKVKKDVDPDTSFAKQLHLSLNGLRTARKRGVNKPKPTAVPTKKEPAPKRQISKLQQRKLYLKELMLRDRKGYNMQFRYLKQLVYSNHPTGQQLFVKVKGIGYWPAVLWELGLCPRSLQKVLFESYVEGSCVARLYGDNSMNWFRAQDTQFVYDSNEFKPDGSLNMKKLKNWIRSKGKQKLFETLLSDIEESSPFPHLEKARLLEKQRCHFDARRDHDRDSCCATCGETVSGQKVNLSCGRCERSFHDICLDPPLFIDEDEENVEIPSWTCPLCSFKNDKVGDEKFVKMGLTPDWLIEEAAFKVFNLKQPTREQPYIKGLLDPCTNSKETPNIPAEVLYDKNDDGLKIENSWKGYYVLLNPEYKASVQWRFINRAIDEVENGHCPTIILVCRNSTDCAYFHRLLPYPRVLLRRNSIHFKDYKDTPIGFGIVVFCIVMDNCPIYYQRFYDAFSQYGEINIPVDSEVFQQDLFHKLMARLKVKAAGTQRDHWAQCEKCETWRQVSYSTILKINANPQNTWTCSDLTDGRGPKGCSAPHSNFELEAQSWDMYRRMKCIEKDRKREARLIEKDKSADQHQEGDEETEKDEDEEEKDDTAVESGLKHVLPWKKIRDHTSISTMKGSKVGDTLRYADNFGLDTSQLTPLELARVTRIAKNKKVLKKLGLSKRPQKHSLPATPSIAAVANGDGHMKEEPVVSYSPPPGMYQSMFPPDLVARNHFYLQHHQHFCQQQQQQLTLIQMGQPSYNMSEAIAPPECDDIETKKVEEELLAIRERVYHIIQEYQRKAMEYNTCLKKLNNMRHMNLLKHSPRVLG